MPSAVHAKIDQNADEPIAIDGKYEKYVVYSSSILRAPSTIHFAVDIMRKFTFFIKSNKSRINRALFGAEEEKKKMVKLCGRNNERKKRNWGGGREKVRMYGYARLRWRIRFNAYIDFRLFTSGEKALRSAVALSIVYILQSHADRNKNYRNAAAAAAAVTAVAAAGIDHFEL